VVILETPKTLVIKETPFNSTLVARLFNSI